MQLVLAEIQACQISQFADLRRNWAREIIRREVKVDEIPKLPKLTNQSACKIGRGEIKLLHS